jgi:predicted ATPase/signal transduction histidine kinase/CheY-like chemotaxis protein/tRNA A-37 threonylcarbamoyl transferase component Bud32
MLTIAGCRIIELLSENHNSLVYRGYRLADRQPIVLKMIKDPYPDPERLAAFKQEYEILRRLNIEGAIKAYRLETGEQQRLIMLLEDFGGQSLAALKLAGQLAIKDFLKFGISITETLGKIHAKNIIHQDINLFNLILNPETEQIKFIDFSIAIIQSRKKLKSAENHLWQGTVAYMSPEQTGRINRSIDIRTDFYSLGVTFYELLTGQLPFQGNDLSIIHGHIAKQPTPPHQVNPAIPPAISSIIMKMLAKDPEDRYQSAWGIQSDLVTCLMQLESGGNIKDMIPGSNDISDRFKLSQKIYGRNKEFNKLNANLDQLVGHKPRILSLPRLVKSMIIVTGDAGIGKSALVQEFYQPIIQKGGYFISGKCQPDVPYSPLITALAKLINQLLSESKDQLNQWRNKINLALGHQLQLMIDLIPDLTLILDRPEENPELDPVVSPEIVQQSFLNLLRVFCTGEYPLGIFLDDLQWADAATLKLLELIIPDSETYYLFVIAAYRDNEVSPTDPLAIALKRIRQKGIMLHEIHVLPLCLADITDLIAESFHLERTAAKPLAAVVEEKTNGNPFFIKEFITCLYQQKLIRFDRNALRWEWDLAAIAQCEIAENVVNFLADQIVTLPESTQKLLPVAACIGMTFDISTLATLTEYTATEVLTNLLPAIQAKLLLPLNCELNYSQPQEAEAIAQYKFKFQHKKLQIIAEFMSDSHLRTLTKLQIGRLLLQQNQPTKNNIFEVVNYYNRGIAGIKDLQEKIDLAELNLKAAQIAKEQNQYAAVFNYLQIARKLLDERMRENYQSLRQTIYLELIEAYYVQENFTQAENLANFVLQQAKNKIDVVRFYEIKIKIKISRQQMKLAWQTGLYVLEQLGVHLVKSLSSLPSIEELENLPKIADDQKQIALRILKILYIPVQAIAPDQLSSLAQTMVILCITYGNCAEAAFAYVLYGVILCEKMLNFELGYEFGELALRILDRYHSPQVSYIVLKLFNAKIRIFKQPAKLAVKDFRKLIKAETSLKQMPTCCEAELLYNFGQFFIGRLKIRFTQFAENPLNDVGEASLNKYFNSIWPNLVWIFLNKPENYSKNQEIITFWSQAEQLPESQKTYFHQRGLFNFHLAQTIVAYWFKNYANAVNHAILAANYEQAAESGLAIATHKFYSSLSMLAQLSHQEIDASDRAAFWQKVAENQEQMKIWAEHAPINFFHKYQLVEAEKARCLGEYWQAGLFYDRAISEAQKNHYIQEAALGYELAAEFYFSQNLSEIGHTYLIKAHQTYIEWQGWGKVRDLESRYTDVFGESLRLRENPKIRLSKSESSQTGSISNHLDLNVILKAAQTLSSEIVLERLLEKMLQLVLENAGAQKGYLLTFQADHWVISASGSLAPNQSESIQVQPSIPIGGENDFQAEMGFSRAIVNYVIHTQENLVLNDAVHEGNFTHDLYILQHQPKSILCAPLINQGKLMGILYLENNLATGAFTADRLEVLKLVSSQAAIALENAHLYAQLEDYSRSLEQKVKQRTEELAQATRQAQAASEAKSLFLANMSHELRTPLNAILGFAQVINRSSNLSSEHQENLHIIMRSGEHLLNLINQVLDFSKIEAGRITLNQKNFDLFQLLADLEDMFYLKAEEKMLQLIFYRSPEVPQYILTDQIKLRQVLINLLNNAIKFTESGGVSLRVRTVDDLSLSHGSASDASASHRSQQLLFEVEDTGMGIAPDEINSLFQAFTQTKTGQASQEGTGLGLALSASFVKLMGGEIRVKSEVGHGTTFQFNIQVDLVAPEQVEPQQPERQILCLEPHQPPYRILIVDDKPDNRQLLVKLLSPLGFELQTATNGQEAIQVWESFSPDLVWMDLRMPVMNGYEATERIKASPKGKETVIIALTASILEEERSLIFAAGCDDLVYKPFRPQTIFEKMAHYLGLRYIYETTALSSVSSHGSAPKTTLNREILSVMPVDWVVNLHQGALEADADFVGELIEEIPESQALLAEAIQGLVNKFQFEKIIELTELIINEERSG